MIEALFRFIKMDGSGRYNHEYKGRDKVISLFMILLRLFRGFRHKLLMKASFGIILVGRGVKIFNKQYISAGRNFNLDDFCEVNGLSKRGLIFGHNNTIGKGALIRPTNQYGGTIGEGLKVGDNSNIGPYSYIGCSGYIEIGNNVMISPRVSIYAENHNFESIDIPMKQQGVTRESVVIEDDCWLAANCIVLAGVRVGKGSIVAAGSVVTKNVPQYTIVAGNPAKIVRTRHK